MSNDLLSGIFTQEFIDRIGSKGYKWYNTKSGKEFVDENGDGVDDNTGETLADVTNCAAGADPYTDADACGEVGKKIKTKVDAAEYLYELYITEADMVRENNGGFNFAQYFKGHESDAEWFAYLLDKDDFYEKGPGFAGHDDSYKNAQPLLDDFFNAIDNRKTTDTVATFRFGHAETVVPFAALLKLPGSTQSAPDVADPQSIHDVYNYDDNGYRSESVGPMAVNVQWDVVGRDGVDPATGKAYTPLVRVLYNEKEVALDGAQCVAVADGSHWYKESELKRCLGYTGYQDTGESPTITVDSTTPGNGDNQNGQNNQNGNGQNGDNQNGDYSQNQSDAKADANAKTNNLASTGITVMPLAGVTALLIAGAGLLVWRRRRV